LIINGYVYFNILKILFKLESRTVISFSALLCYAVEAVISLRTIIALALSFCILVETRWAYQRETLAERTILSGFTVEFYC
jgi:hypothetical protein